MKNIAIILSGGTGKRFDSTIPKQYIRICNKPCIDYVINAAKAAKSIDKIIIVMDEKYKTYSNELENNKIEIVKNGNTRYGSIKNAFKKIVEEYDDCENIIILQAVSPLVYPELIDKYIELLNENDCVITARKLVGEIGIITNIDKVFDRDKYYLMESPEAFKFRKIYDSFKPNFFSSELAYQLPKGSKKYLYFDFPENIKITYKHDLKICEALLLNNESIDIK